MGPLLASAASIALIASGAMPARAAETVVDGGATVTVPSLSYPSPWATGGDLTVGKTGTGTLTIESGGQVASDTGQIGAEAGATGVVTVTGAGSSWDLGTSGLAVGGLGTGTLTISDGGAVSAKGVGIGSAGTGSGTVTVTGSGSALNSGTSGLLIGFSGTSEGALIVEAGAKVTGGGLLILGVESGATGTATVSGAGAKWETTTSFILVGKAGAGTLTIADAGEVVTSAIALASDASSTGTLNLNGTSGARGILTAIGVGVGDGTAQINFDGGILRAADDVEDMLFGFQAGEVTIKSGGAFIDSNGFAVTITTPLSGVGGLTKQGDGTLTLSGVNTYAGATVIEAGTLALSGAGSIATSSAVTVDGTLDISGTTSGTAIKTLSGASTGSVVLGEKALTVDQGAEGTFAGVISGDGALVKQGTGTLILTGANTFTGGTTISAGTLQVGNGGTAGSLAGAVANNAALVFDLSGSYSVSNALSGSGTLTFTGGGTATLSSSGTFSGATHIDGATVSLSGASLSASVFSVEDGGTLTGQGTIGGLVVKSGGVAAPGSSPGTLTVDGAVSFESGAIYRVDVTPLAHDLITATGAVTLSTGASVHLTTGAAAMTPGTAYAILTTTGTLSGEFGALTGDLETGYLFLTPGLSHDAHTVYLSLLHNGILFSSFARTPNETAAADAAQALGAGSPIYDALLLFPDTTSPEAAFAALSGEAYASVNSVIQQQSIYVRDAVLARLDQSVAGAAPTALADAKAPAAAQLAPDLTPTLWMQGYGGWGKTFSDGNAATVSSTIGGVLMGADVAVGETARAGVFAGYGRTSFDVDARASSGGIDTYDMGLYAGGRIGAAAWRGGLAYAWHDVSLDRQVTFPNYSDAPSGDYAMGSVQAFGELAYRVSMGRADFEPFAGLAYLGLSGARVREAGGGAALQADMAAMDTLYTTLGLRTAVSVDLAGRPLTPSLSLGWQHAFGDTTPTAAMLFQGGTTPFQVAGAPIAEDAVLVDAKLAYALSGTASLSVGYSGQLAGNAGQNAFTAQLAVAF